MKHPQIEVYKGRKNSKPAWRFRVRSANNEIVARDTQGYPNKQAAIKGTRGLLRAMEGFNVVVLKK